jgi:2-phospho-L-lactate/phosphoenolpyruvate guanylyltransferase
MVIVLLPMKDPAGAKQRLAAFLTPAERAGLAWAMFTDVCEALLGSALCDGAVVVSSSSRLLSHAAACGLQTMEETGQSSESRSVDAASRLLASRGAEAVLRLPGDIPLVRAADVDELLSVPLKPPACLIVPSRDGSGTNALLRTPPTVFPSRFGPNSRMLHGQEAEEAGADFVILENLRISLDVDDVSDLEAFLAMRAGGGAHTYGFLESIGVPERISKVELTADYKARPISRSTKRGARPR